MNGAARATRQSRLPAPTATLVLKFDQRRKLAPRRPQVVTLGRVPRIPRLLALAHRIDGMIRAGEIRDWAEAGRLMGVTRARMTQIANMTLLAPEIQGAILEMPPVADGRDSINERLMRQVARTADWAEQRRTWNGETAPHASTREESKIRLSVGWMPKATRLN